MSNEKLITEMRQLAASPTYNPSWRINVQAALIAAADTLEQIDVPEPGEPEADFPWTQITYVCRDIGYGVESGTAVGTWGERDWTGKRSFVSRIGSATLYLFDDEIVEERGV